MANLGPSGIIRSPWLYQAEAFRMADRLYYVGNTSVSSHLFDTGDGLLLLDTTYMQSAYLLLESIRDLGFDPHQIKWILHTHAHVDHFGGTRQLVEKYGCRTYLPAADLDFMSAKQELNYVETFGQPYEPPYDCFFEPDEAVEPGAVLRFGEIEVDCYSAAGHTPGTMAYVFHLPSGLKAGMHGGIGLNTLTSEYCTRFGLGDAWRRAYAESLERLKGLEVDVVLGNHPEQSHTFEKLSRKKDGLNPFVDAGEWDRFLEQTRIRFERFLQSDPL